MRILLSAIRDDARKATVRASIVSEEPRAAELFNRPRRFKVELRIGRITDDGHRHGWSEPYCTKTRRCKTELVPLFSDLLQTVVPSTLYNE